MARAKAYRRDEVIDRALDTFWGQGFQATSMRDLVAACHIVPTSLYSEFGDKAAFFSVVLERYVARQSSFYASALGGEPAGLPRLRQHFDRYTYSRSFRGCLMVDALGERAHLREEDLEAIDRFFERVRGLMRRNLEPHFDRASASLHAHTLLALDLGLASAGKLPSQRRHLRQAVDVLLRTLEEASTRA